MEAKVFYQDFQLNALAIINKTLKLDKINAVQVSRILHFHDDLYRRKTEVVLNTIFEKFNHLGEGFEFTSLGDEVFKKAGHTSMSIGDFVEFSNGDIWICDVVGWKKYEDNTQKA